MLFIKKSSKLKSEQKTKKIQLAPKLKGKNRDILQLKADLAAFGITDFKPERPVSRKKAVLVNPKAAPKQINAKTDQKKRQFLKYAGLAGLGVVASSLIPKKAQALVFGSTPASNVVGVKNIANTRINPATEETLQEVATETTLSGVKTTTDKLQFDGSNNLKITGTVTGGTDPVGIKDEASNTINPVSEESLIYLRRLVKLSESSAVVDSAYRQRITVDIMPTTTVTGTITAVTTVSNMAALGGVDGRYLLIDTARNAYANSIRNNLTWS